MVFSCFKNETGLSSVSKTTSKLGNLTVFGRILHLESHRSQYKDTFSSISCDLFTEDENKYFTDYADETTPYIVGKTQQKY